MREHAKRAGPLPVVVDDVLVNFDPDRARATITVLREPASTHQVLVVARHPHVARWSQETLADVSVRPMPRCAWSCRQRHCEPTDDENLPRYGNGNDVKQGKHE